MSKRILDLDSDWQYLHIIFKAVGKGHASDQYIFSQRIRKEFIEQLQRFLKLYSPIELIGFCCVSNHAHCLFAVPKTHNVSLSQTARQYEECYKKPMDARSHKCHILRKNLNNISKFCQRFEMDFAKRFNKKCMNFNRTGALWVPKFHNSLIMNWKSMIRCWRYIEFNSVKAGLAKHPGEYITGLWGIHDEAFREQCLRNFYKHYSRVNPSFNGTQCSYEDFLKMLSGELTEEAVTYESMNKEDYSAQNILWHHHIIGDAEQVEAFLAKNHKNHRTKPVPIKSELDSELSYY